MRRINDLYVCFFVSLTAHTGLISSGMFLSDPAMRDKPLEVSFEVEEEILPRQYEIREEKKIGPPVVEEKEIVKPAADETILERKPVIPPEDEKSKKSLLRYQDSIKQKIQQEKKYPRRSLRAGHEGSVKITFFVLPSGQIRDLRLLGSSGFEELDKEALSAAGKASPFPAFPSGLYADELQFEIEIIFRIKGSS